MKYLFLILSASSAFITHHHSSLLIITHHHLSSLIITHHHSSRLIILYLAAIITTYHHLIYRPHRQDPTRIFWSENDMEFRRGFGLGVSRLIFCTSPHTHTHMRPTSHGSAASSVRAVPLECRSLSHCCAGAPRVVLGAARRPCVLVQRMTRSDALVDRVREARHRRFVVKALAWLAVALTVARRAHYGAVCRRQRSPNSSL